MVYCSPPSDTIEVSAVDECSENELALLVLRSCCEYSNGEESRANRVPPHKDIFRVIENAHAKGADGACLARGLASDSSGYRIPCHLVSLRYAGFELDAGGGGE